MKIGLALVAIAALPATALAQLKVTEVWTGQGGTDVTADWFEVTNLGLVAWDLNTNPLWFDDSSANPTASAALTGISSIAPGESVVFLEGGDAAGFMAVWGSMVSGLQVGGYSGSGLSFSQGGDGVNLFDSNLVGAAVIDSITFPAQATDAFSWIFNPKNGLYQEAQLGVLDAFASEGLGGDLLDTPAVGSPGKLPTPGALGVLGLAGALGLRRRR